MSNSSPALYRATYAPTSKRHAVSLALFCQFSDFREPAGNIEMAASPMGDLAIAAVLDAFRVVGEVAPAALT